jgi:soluble lytic murein transglycosylase-like protein
LERVRGDLAVKDLKLDRLTTVSQYSAAYHIPADVAGQIYDAALAEGIHPSLGYQLVKVESGFQARAKSSAGALGYTQIQLRTARSLDSTVTEQRLLGSETNLRLGFRWLKRLLGQFDHDLELALRAYNLGPTGALTALSDTASEDVGGAYARAVISGLGRAKISGRNR